MPAVARSVEVEVPRAHFYEVVAAYERYPDFLSEVEGVQVRRQGQTEAEVTYTLEVDVGIARKRFRYTLLHTGEPPEWVRWRFVAGEIFRKNEGTWRLEEIGPARTRATYTIEVGFGLLVPRAVSTFLTERGLPKMLAEFKGRAERLWSGR